MWLLLVECIKHSSLMIIVLFLWKNLCIESGKGFILCMEKALAQCGVAREDVNYVNANAVSSPAEDLKEYRAITHCFGKNPGVRKLKC